MLLNSSLRKIICREDWLFQLLDLLFDFDISPFGSSSSWQKFHFLFTLPCFPQYWLFLEPLQRTLLQTSPVPITWNTQTLNDPAPRPLLQSLRLWFKLLKYSCVKADWKCCLKVDVFWTVRCHYSAAFIDHCVNQIFAKHLSGVIHYTHWT